MARGTPRSWQVEEKEDANVSRVAGIVTAKLRQVKRLTGHEFNFLLQHSPGGIKMTLPSVTQFPANLFSKRGVTDSGSIKTIRAAVEFVDNYEG